MTVLNKGASTSLSTSPYKSTGVCPLRSLKYLFKVSSVTFLSGRFLALVSDGFAEIAFFFAKPIFVAVVTCKYLRKPNSLPLPFGFN